MAAVAFNCDGSRLAVGVSCTWDEGEEGFKANPVRPWLGVRRIGDEAKVWGFCSYSTYLFPPLIFFLTLFFAVLAKTVAGIT